MQINILQKKGKAVKFSEFILNKEPINEGFRDHWTDDKIRAKVKERLPKIMADIQKCKQWGILEEKMGFPPAAWYAHVKNKVRSSDDDLVDKPYITDNDTVMVGTIMVCDPTSWAMKREDPKEFKRLWKVVEDFMKHIYKVVRKHNYICEYLHSFKNSGDERYYQGCTRVEATTIL